MEVTGTDALSFKALWFLVSLLLYAVGSVLFQAGRALIKISGWGADEDSGGDDPMPPAPTANT